MSASHLGWKKRKKSWKFDPTDQTKIQNNIRHVPKNLTKTKPKRLDSENCCERLERLRNWLKKLILGGSCSFPCIFVQCIRDIFKTFQFSRLKSFNPSSCGKTQLGTDLPHHLRAQGPGTVELSSYPAEDTHHVIPISKGSKGQNKRVGQKHEKTKRTKKTRSGNWQNQDGCGCAAAASPVPPGFTSSKLAVARAPAGPAPAPGAGAAASLGAFGGVSASRLWRSSTQRWHNVMTMLRSHPVLDAFVWVSAALATRLGKKAQNTRNHKHHAVYDGDSCDLCLLTLLSVQLNVSPMPWS